MIYSCNALHVSVGVVIRQVDLIATVLTATQDRDMQQQRGW